MVGKLHNPDHLSLARPTNLLSVFDLSSDGSKQNLLQLLCRGLRVIMYLQQDLTKASPYLSWDQQTPLVNVLV